MENQKEETTLSKLQTETIKFIREYKPSEDGSDAKDPITMLKEYTEKIVEATKNDIQYGYLMNVGGEKVFVIAENISEAMDRMEKETDKDFSMYSHRSIDVLF